MPIPRATARLQLNQGFTLDKAAEVVDYLADLGVSHLYLSPVFQARPGSSHGYDGTDPNMINPEIGGEAALLRLVERVRSRGLGLVLDIVSNHMASISPDNSWWTDVLRNGWNSSYAHFFDIDWQRRPTRGKVLLPLLDRQYGEALAAGKIRLTYQAEESEFGVECSGRRLPLCPESQAALGAMMSSGRLSPEEVLLGHDPANGGGERLHALLEFQAYRLAWWRTAADEINWRRFFEVSELVGVRVELPEVFEAMHALLFRMYRDGWIDGVRVDHVDGLADPGGYCRSLRERLNRLAAERPDRADGPRPYLIVEKILADDEPLRTDWAVDGTTGYDFMSDVCAVLHDGAGEEPLSRLWAEVGPAYADLDSQLSAVRRKLLRENFTSEFESLARLFKEVADSDLKSRDFSLTMIRRGLAALMEQFRVYRTYWYQGRGTDQDRAVLDRAAALTRRSLRPAEHGVLDWLVACFEPARSPAFREANVRARALMEKAVIRFQQLTSPLAAKSLEDTVFYRYLRLISRNEVGSDPARFFLSPEEFHRRVLARGARFPLGMLATATHDHKRGEDGRARLAVISEAPAEWRRRVGRWLSDSSGLDPDRFWPDPVDRYMIFQTLIGAWPNSPAEPDELAEIMGQLEKRLIQWLDKALKESKRHTDWAASNPEYEEAGRAYLRNLFAGLKRENSVLADLMSFVDLIAPAGAINILAQVTLKLTVPGVPDLYQGTEKWDFSLVDPDNRRPVDFKALKASLAETPDWQELVTNWRDGRLKQNLIHQILRYRREQAQLFQAGRYAPLELTGRHSGRGLAFIRRLGDHMVIVAVSRLSFPLLEVARTKVPLVNGQEWGDTALTVPENSAGHWRNLLSGCPVGAQGQKSLLLAEVLEKLPVALLIPASIRPGPNGLRYSAGGRLGAGRWPV